MILGAVTTTGLLVAYAASLASGAVVDLEKRSLTGKQIAFFPESGCSFHKQFTYFRVGPRYPSCSITYFGGAGFKRISGGDTYQAWVKVPAIPDNCQIILRQPSTAQRTGCGIATTRFLSGQEGCHSTTITQKMGLNWCCGNQCNKISKRDDDMDALPFEIEEREAEPQEFTTDIAERDAELGELAADIEERDLDLEERSGGCKFVKSGGLFTADGTTKQVSQIISCGDASQCREDISIAREKSSSQTFGVTTMVSADLFEIVQASVSFSYMYTYEKSKTVTGTYSFTLKKGQRGYVSFTPLLECHSGHFKGSGCKGKHIPTGKMGRACIPKTVSGEESGQPDGTTTFVTEE